MTCRDPRAVVEAVWRLESARIVAALARLVRDVSVAEEVAQDALVAALEEWPETGVPDNPPGWLMLTAKHRAIDRLRRHDRFGIKLAEIGRTVQQDQQASLHDGTIEFDAVINDDDLSDDILRLIFVACHPALTTESRVAFTLRTVAGLTTEEIAAAFLVPVSTVAQRIVRAKRTIAEKRIPFEVPAPAERASRLASVLEVVYLVFNEGYSATLGDDWLRPALCADGLRLARVLAELAPGEAEVHGLVALMEIQSSRLRARLGPEGEPIPLLEQDRGRWDRLHIQRGFTALLRAEQLRQPVGPYVLQAAIAACHAHARTAEDTDWSRIAALYANLARLMPTQVVELNRAVAVGMADGPAAGLALLEPLADDPALRDYHLLPAVRADLLRELGRVQEARVEYERAAAMTRNRRERDALHAHAASLAG